MTLKELLQNVDYQEVQGDLSVAITGITADSRLTSNGSVFVCYPGVSVDGHTYISQALQQGASAVVVEKEISSSEVNGVPVVRVADGRVALSSLAANFYGNPAQKLRIAGITGTNGKTSTSYMAYNILKANPSSPGLLGTINFGYGGKWQKAAGTTPDAVQLQRILGEMYDAGIDSIIMEVTSHALAQKRVAGMEFDLAVFTNLTQDHLDFHHSMKDYLDAKLQLFRQLRSVRSHAILNADEEVSQQIRTVVKGSTVTYGIQRQADFMATNIQKTNTGLTFQIHSPSVSFPVELPILGEYNVYNALAASAVGTLWGCSPQSIQQGLLATVVPGRFEMVRCGQDFTVIVDYAHTPDALENVLREARKFTDQKLICVFGCGGDRDRGKRPLMGEIAVRLADLTIITSDNPRTEAPEAIIQDILQGVEGHVGASSYEAQPNRGAAIKRALELADVGDMVVIAGKGHEDYQLIGDRRIHFDDREVAARILEARRKG